MASLALTGCGGPVLGTTELPKSGTADDSAQLTYGLPVAFFPITIKRDDKCTVTASLDKAVFVRDPNWNFRLDYFHHTYTNDSLSVQTDDVGLLTAINTTSENQTLAIVDQAFAVAAQAEKAPPIRMLTATAPACTAFSLTYVFNPLEKSQRDALNDLIVKNEGSVKNVHVGDVTLVGANEAYHGASCAPAGCSLPQPAFCLDAATNQCIYFRKMRSFALPVVVENANTEVDLFFQAPDATIYAIPMRRDDFVKFDVKLTFDHGVLTGYASNNPSQALAVLQIPSDLIKDIVGLNTSSSSVTAGAKTN
jgi:hypothetical protein